MKKTYILLSLLSINSLMAATLTTDKDNYATTETIKINFTEMDNHNKDWVGIYPADSTTAWENVLKWAWTENKSEGLLTFKNLPIGEYEVRAFYNNSYNTEAKKAFTVEGDEETEKAKLVSTKDVFQTNEDVRINFENINGDPKDWLAIYPAESNNDRKNIIKKKFNKGAVKQGRANFGKLLPGEYEARIFYNNTLKMEAKVAFSVEGLLPTENVKLYEDAEGGFDQEWFAADQNKRPKIINEGAAGSSHSVRVHTSGGIFSFNNPSKDMKFLILDTRIGIASHRGNFGVKIKTKNGDRRMFFSSYMNHPKNDLSGNAIPMKPFSKNNYLLNYPGPTDYYLETKNGNFVHYKINIEEKLQILEPDNKLLSITHFTSAGGDFDNIKLSSI